MNTLTVRAPAKINLTLDVLGKRPDGYHDIKTIMQAITLADDVSVTLAGEGETCVSSNIAYLPADGRNIAVKAADAFFAKTGIHAGAKINLLKRIPVAAGLAGGSTNAAAVLTGLNALCGGVLSYDELGELALKLGADVPFCLRGGAYLAEGVGERLTRVRVMPQCHIVLTKPPGGVSTARIYEKLDNAGELKRPDSACALAALQNGDLTALAKSLGNVMEQVTACEKSSVTLIKSQLLRYGALGAIMSGSGPSVFGLFDDADAAEYAYSSLKSRYDDTFMTSPWEGAQTII